MNDLADRAIAAIDRDFLLALLKDMIETPSPAGSEGPLAQLLVAALTERGIAAEYQPINEARGNCIGRYRGTGGGRDLLLYGHLDPTFSAVPGEDRAVLGDVPRPDLVAKLSMSEDGMLSGLGITNPKGGTACAIAAVDALKRAGVSLAGDVILGLVAGGIHRRPITSLNNDFQGPKYQGFGIGCEYMLKHGVTADYAISTKPGYYISWEDPGQCWFVVEVKGSMIYTGLRHVIKHSNPLVPAAKLVQALEAWMPEYTKLQTRGQLTPQGSVGAIEGGWPFKPEFIPGICHVYVSMNCNSETSPHQVRRIFEGFLDRFRADNPEVDLDYRMLLSQAGSHTDRENWIVQSCRRALETVEGKKHADVAGLSGTSDTNILRNWGIPTVRLGLPALMTPNPDWPPMYDVSRIEDFERVIKVYVHTIVDTCGRTDW